MNTQNQKRPTLRDVARVAGVSHMTVSRVVRGLGTVSPATRRRVEQAVAGLGYRPDPALSALASYRTREGGRSRGSVLAFLNCDDTGFSRLVLEGTRLEAERLGYAVEVFRLPSVAPSQRRLCRTLFHRGIRGLLLGPSDFAQEIPGWEWEHFAAVSLGALPHQPAVNGVAMDYFDGVTKAFVHLEERGCRRIGMAVRSSLESRTGHRWLGGYAAQSGRGALVFDGDLADGEGFRGWVRRNRIDGMLTIHPHVWQMLRPAKIPIVFLNAFDCPPGVPHIAFDAARIGIEGVRLVHHQILNQEFGLPDDVKTVALQGTLRIR